MRVVEHERSFLLFYPQDTYNVHRHIYKNIALRTIHNSFFGNNNISMNIGAVIIIATLPAISAYNKKEKNSSSSERIYKPSKKQNSLRTKTVLYATTTKTMPKKRKDRESEFKQEQ